VDLATQVSMQLMRKTCKKIDTAARWLPKRGLPLQNMTNGQMVRLASRDASGRETDRPFEVVVAEANQRHSYEVDCQVGVANYFIDLAIRHPDRPDSYLPGMECDGATYHAARAARDRDKYRQGIFD